MFRPWRSLCGSGVGRPGAARWERNRLHCGRWALHALPVPKGRGVTDGCILDIPFSNSCLIARIKGQLCLAHGKGITSSTMIVETGFAPLSFCYWGWFFHCSTVQHTCVCLFHFWGISEMKLIYRRNLQCFQMLLRSFGAGIATSTMLQVPTFKVHCSSAAQLRATARKVA